jgi:paraquat-inducible protein B
MSEPPTPRVRRRFSIPLIWVVPLVALAIAGWMIARQFRDRGPEISIEFADAAGIEPSRTIVEHHGVTVGTVRDLELKPDLSGVVAHVRLTKAGAKVAREGSQFWILHPQVGFSGIRGLETLVSGVRLQVRPGDGPMATSFRGLDTPPSLDDPQAGRAFLLRAEKLGGLTPGSPVYSRGDKGGVGDTTRLAEDATAAVIRVRVFTPYVDLVRTNTQFWNASGVSLKFGLSGAEFRSTTLQSLISGGVSFATPDGAELAPTALENTEFYLHPDPDKDWGKWTPRIRIKPVESTPASPKPEQGGATMPAEISGAVTTAGPGS